MTHEPVMTQELLAGLQALGPAARVLDATFGRGGHSRAVLSCLGPEGLVTALDWDEDAVQVGHELARADARFDIHHAAFADIAATVAAASTQSARAIDAVILDLGVSSPQLETAERGFSFLQDGPLDMRMDQRRGRTAQQFVNTASESELADCFFKYADERYSRRIARAIVAARQTATLASTLQLAEVVAAAHPRWPRHQHPATRVFQALRIWVNEEDDQLTQALVQCAEVLRIGGRALVISFHSGEDRRVKQAFAGPPRPSDPRIARLPPAAQTSSLTSPLTSKKWRALGGARRPSEVEVQRNPRARSAVLRIAERVA